MENLYSLLAPGGQVLLAFPICRIFLKTYRKVCAFDQWRQYFEGVERKVPSFPIGDPQEEFEELLRSVGFQVKKCKVEDKDELFSSITGFETLVQALDPQFTRVPEELRPQYLEDCVQVIKEAGVLATVDRWGEVRFTQTFMLIVANKPK